jgi:hypothetical protein
MSFEDRSHYKRGFKGAVVGGLPFEDKNLAQSKTSIDFVE